MKEREGVLFDAEEMNRIEKGNLWSQQQGPGAKIKKCAKVVK